MSAQLASLLKKATIEDHNEVLRVCNAALKASKNDGEAQQVKTVALLKLERYEEVVDFVGKCGPTLEEKASFEYAYALYKVGRWEDAANVASGKPEDRGSQHLHAQALYRAEQFSKAANIYRSLAGSSAQDDGLDFKVNESAIRAQLQWSGVEDVQGKKPGREDLEAFETAYNAASESITRNELGQADVLLKRAKQLCRHSEDLSPEQKVEELVPICVQQIYVLQRLGKASEAEAIIPEIQTDQVPDPVTRLIAQNNVLVGASKQSNAFEIHKAFHSAPSIPQLERPFAFQKSILDGNESSVNLTSFKFNAVESSALKSMQNSSSPSILPNVVSSSVLYASAVARNEEGSTALRRIAQELEKRPKDVGLVLTVVKINCDLGNLAAATQTMESFLRGIEADGSEYEEVRYNPGLISVLIGLYKKQGRNAQTKSELAKAASYWCQQPNPPPALLQSAGASLMESSDVNDIESAREIFTTLRKDHRQDKAAMAGYIASHEGGISRSELEQLPSVAKLTKGVDVDALEAAGIPQSANALAIAQGRARKRAAPEAELRKAKRVRKSRLPKDYDPEKKADPERWLPLRDRSSYKPKGRRKGKKAGEDRTQGGVVAEDVGVNGVVTAKPQAGNAGGGGGGGNKKKKGKGKK